MESEWDEVRLRRDLAFAATQQAKRQTAATLQRKTALEADIADLQARVSSYPTDLQDRLDALSAATDAYRNATAVNEGGPLITFLKKSRSAGQKRTAQRPKFLFTICGGEYRQKQEQRLNTKAVQARQQATEVQRQLPAVQLTVTQLRNFHEMDL